MRALRRHVATLALVASGCGGDVRGARDQWTVLITTDAPLPQFGDRLLVEVHDGTGTPSCPECRREMGVPRTWPLSFGVVPPPSGEAPHVRVRLYRSEYTGADGLPLGSAVIDARGSLPPAHGDTRVQIHLALPCFGVTASTLDGKVCDPETGELGPEAALHAPGAPLPEPGSAELGRSLPCKGPVPPGMACVEGGAFLLGAPRFFALGEPLDPVPEHLVRLDAYALDVREFTVGRMRRLILDGKLDGEPALPSSDPNDFNAACTYLGRDVSTHDDLPVTCVTADLARRACAALGLRLPTEAEWEFAAGNRTAETPFPWGFDDDACAHAVISRGRGLLGEETACLGAASQASGPVPGGSRADLTLAGVGDLGGNVTEWVADSFASYSAPCWARGTVLQNPRCSTPSAATDPQSLRGGSWSTPPLSSRATQRNALAAGGFDAYTGFRCARSP